MAKYNYKTMLKGYCWSHGLTMYRHKLDEVSYQLVIGPFKLERYGPPEVAWENLYRDMYYLIKRTYYDMGITILKDL